LTQVADSSYWPSFAACAAEADLMRLAKSEQVSTSEFTKSKLPLHQ